MWLTDVKRSDLSKEQHFFQNPIHELFISFRPLTETLRQNNKHIFGNSTKQIDNIFPIHMYVEVYKVRKTCCAILER